MKKITLAPFEQALLDVNLEEFMDVPTEQDIDMEFSGQFQVKADELIQKSERNHWSSGKVFLRKVALVALIAGLLLLTACAVRLIWENIISFQVEDAGTHYEFFYDPDDIANAPRWVETVYFPSYLPAGYKNTLTQYTVAGVFGFWEAENERSLNFFQELLPEDPLSGESGDINSEGAGAEWITVNNCQVLRIEDKEWISYVWVTNQYEFSIMCQKPISDDEIIKVFDSIRVVEDAVIIGAE